MICTELYNGQGLGNQLWLYAVTRTKALDLGVDFGIMNPEKFKGLHFLDLDFGRQVFGGSGPEGGPPLLLRNDQDLRHNWLRFQLIGSKSNRDGIGAWVKVRTGNQVLSRQVMPAKSYLSQSELPVTVGLGTATRVDEVTVVWPGKQAQKVTDWRLNGLTTVTQP